MFHNEINKLIMQHTTLQFEGAWSFGNSHKSQWYLLPSKDMPAPDKYQPTQSTTVPAWTIGQAQRRLTEISENVGVGTYDPNVSAVYPSSNNPTIGNAGKRVRSPRVRKILPIHPKIQVIKPKAPVYSFGYKFQTQYDNGIPGPGDYQRTTFPTEASFYKADHNFTMGSKIQQSGSKIPGVGEYNVSKQFKHSPNARFGNALRPEPGLNNSSPGLYYYTDEKRKEGGITMGYQLPVSFIKMNVPGPNKYNVAEKKRYQLLRQKSMYTSKRTDCINNTATSETTGPGSYNISGDLRNNQTGRKIEKSLRDRCVSLMAPGPGSYEHKSSLKKTLGKMVWKYQKAIKFQTPAPGSYNITSPNSDRPKSEHSAAFPLALRPKVERSTTNNIGPGQYDINKRPSSQSGAIGKNPRRCVTTTDNPGPGYYEIPTTIGRLPKYFKSLHRKINEFGETKIIKYDPKSFAQTKLVLKSPPTETNTEDKKK